MKSACGAGERGMWGRGGLRTSLVQITLNGAGVDLRRSRVDHLNRSLIWTGLVREPPLLAWIRRCSCRAIPIRRQLDRTNHIIFSKWFG